jgi:hypothetical protein
MKTNSSNKTVHTKIQPVVVKHVIKQHPPAIPQLELKVTVYNKS